jgi:hypothetical protein
MSYPRRPIDSAGRDAGRLRVLGCVKAVVLAPADMCLHLRVARYEDRRSPRRVARSKRKKNLFDAPARPTKSDVQRPHVRLL